MRRFTVVVSMACLVAALFAPGAAAAEPYCGIRWGSLAKADDRMSEAPVVDVRAGRHACFDRLVFDLDGSRAPGYRVRYVRSVEEEGSGRTLRLRGGAYLQVTALSPAYDEEGNATFVPRSRREVVDVEGFRTFRQVRWAGSFEGVTTLGLGVRARLPFRVFTLQGPGGRTRLVVDVAHRW